MSGNTPAPEEDRPTGRTYSRPKWRKVPMEVNFAVTKKIERECPVN